MCVYTYVAVCAPASLQEGNAHTARSTLITGALPGLADWSFGQAQTKPRWELRGLGDTTPIVRDFPVRSKDDS